MKNNSIRRDKIRYEIIKNNQKKGGFCSKASGNFREGRTFKFNGEKFKIIELIPIVVPGNHRYTEIHIE